MIRYITTLAPLLGLQIKLLLSTRDSLKPSTMACATWRAFLPVFKNEIIDGPAPLMVTAREGVNR